MTAKYIICSMSKTYIQQAKASVQGLEFSPCFTAAVICISPQNISFPFLLPAFTSEGRETMTAPGCLAITCGTTDLLRSTGGNEPAPDAG